MCPEGFPTQVTLVRLLSAVDPQVHVEVVLLGEGVATQAAHKRTLVPARVGLSYRLGRHRAGLLTCQRPSHLWMALMCICRPFLLDARWPHSSHTNGFSPRCFAASWTRSSVRVRKVLGHWGHFKMKEEEEEGCLNTNSSRRH